MCLCGIPILITPSDCIFKFRRPSLVSSINVIQSYDLYVCIAFFLKCRADGIGLRHQVLKPKELGSRQIDF